MLDHPLYQLSNLIWVSLFSSFCKSESQVSSENLDPMLIAEPVTVVSRIEQWLARLGSHSFICILGIGGEAGSPKEKKGGGRIIIKARFYIDAG